MFSTTGTEWLSTEVVSEVVSVQIKHKLNSHDLLHLSSSIVRVKKVEREEAGKRHRRKTT